jgi:hypothetical protein
MPETSSSERFDRIEKKLDDLSTSVEARFAAVDTRFAESREEYRKELREVQEHFVEQRQYTEFASEHLERRMTEGFSRLDRRVTEGFSRLERKLDQVIDTQSRPRVTTPPRPRPSKRRR